ncbi:DUF2935 domain-containing protein [Clostridium sp. DJ247]|uniref:DUF2935 domain-containing protein n=1 Tax=Clostridium sp. DJ247 TaxID=2726188 RepID=UPI0016271D5B|nr:DUF2935 domain-containing protein [Clostridium sp. DJ247]MBC2582394.1 DUF2935 domain-containing protein [Clostridium sp. DJ247]
MISDKDFIRFSLETNLFFLRIMKEHIIFVAAALPPKNIALSKQAISIKNVLEKLLCKTVTLSQGVISPSVASSGELITDLTINAEKSTQDLTGIPIDIEITRKELALAPTPNYKQNPKLLAETTSLNKNILSTMNNVIAFKKSLHNNVLTCKTFSYIYPTMLHHVIEEAEFYIMLLNKLQKREALDSIKEIIQVEITWNDIMGEHAEFIRGYLDPSEKQLFDKANAFAKEFDKLLVETRNLSNNPNNLPNVTKKSLNAVTNLRDFKKQGTQGILLCKIKSLIPALLSDHVLREANHYLRLLRDYSNLASV